MVSKQQYILNQERLRLGEQKITKIGEKYYFESLKDQYEKTNNGDFLVLEVESKKSFINKDLMIALSEARKEFPNKLFFIVQIGTLQRPTMNYRKENRQVFEARGGSASC